MDTKAAVFALLTMWGVGTCTTLPASAEDQDVAADEEAASDDLLVNKVWVRTDDSSGMPGSMQIFLPDGTLVTDSCWETYRLSRWEQVSDTAISWDEDGITINADIASLTDSELVLSLKLGSEVQEQHFAPATVPYLCPDIPKD
ncbi:hypothetical protein IC608_01880 [Devosia sp. PTR5]|uniref:Uncharacterized protein n=1 Tax=Devosia oryzisoli TaxID=2774138 RepID=A0A927FQ69_9HYPH|nr:hypothetical protein [Devosia oryzisoli]MBD8064225.1 hypothetical protein [Devosia oryzisoli]